ncbi:peptidoglycan D,D-transpeptidase FtsI family protein [Candidatus Rhodoluna planktonica]|uniref:Cell division protein FtsI n=1 Tax=Candidatus Rhodoluna planktonica TaxID=535712 RepID=A0A1D9E0M8_9MICO|nr:penicillin-binding transpeptidase domain-containing protein [Candidatus Rhodoluna planktonica]AOY56623.1 cell division protein FtsI [Candidatus Rhodoluna planktonica]
MKRELKRVSLVIFVMFLSLFLSATSIQAVNTEELAKDQRNVRAVYDSYKTQRGAILVDGQPIAYSEPADDVYRYLRIYESPMYSAITGFFSIYQGATGLESAMNSYLTGQNSSQFFEQISALLSGNPVQGGSVELTIDPKAQKAAWDALGKMKGAVVAIEPKTGKILAMVSKPGFDANLLAVHSGETSNANYQELLANENGPLLNRALTELYAPGSTFKVIVATAALESGQYTPDSQIPNPVKFQLPGTDVFIQNSGEGKCGGKATVSLADALKLSCNVPFAQLGLALGQDRIRAQAELFGFGKEFEIPMALTPSVYPKGMDEPQTALSAFGQFDDRATVTQMAMVSAAVANGGVLMKPNIIELVQSSNLAVLYQPSDEIASQTMSAGTAALVNQMMVDAVANGVSSNAQISGISVAGKTGTAQNGEDAPYTLWFTGFAPADNPQVAVAVVIADGGGKGQNGRGNSLAAPVARKVMEAVLRK